MPTRRRRERHRRCIVPDCRRHALPGRAVCHDHRRSPAGRAAQAAVHRLAGDLTAALAPAGDDPASPQPWAPGPLSPLVEADARRRATEVFRERLQHGDYAAILNTPVARLAEHAAMRCGLADEIGALRLLLVRLLGAALAADDPARLARAAAQVANAATRAARAHDALAGDPAPVVLDLPPRRLGDGSPARRQPPAKRG